MNWDMMSDYEQVMLYWEFCAAEGYNDDRLTFADFEAYIKESEGR